MSRSIEELRLMHDDDLAKLPDENAKKILENRTKAADFIRLIFARMYCRNDMASSQQWSTIPCITNQGTLGSLNICAGTAFDSEINCIPECEDLGYSDFQKIESAANNMMAGLYIQENKIDDKYTIVCDVQSNSSKKEVSNVPIMPKGWRQIFLPTWRGYSGNINGKVPPELYQLDRIKPKLVCFGLRTCYDTIGKPRRYLNEWLFEADSFPGGIPSWVHNGAERSDPSWWVFNKEQQIRVRKIASDWLYEQMKKLAVHFPCKYPMIKAIDRRKNKEILSLNEACYPKALPKDANGQKEYEENKALVQVVLSVINKKLIDSLSTRFLVRRVFSGGIGHNHDYDHEYNKLSAMFDGFLLRAIYYKLKPVIDSVMWMVDKQAMVQYAPNYGVYLVGVQFRKILEVAAEGIGETLCQGMDEEATKLIENDMVNILYENGPVYVK